MSIVGALAGIASREPWQEQAVCAQVDPEIFFPDKGGSPRQAKQICAECPVRLQCLEFALEHNERHGVFGGLTERERQSIRKRPPVGFCGNGHERAVVGTTPEGHCAQCRRESQRSYDKRRRLGLSRSA